jgi:hypothetical protein
VDIKPEQQYVIAQTIVQFRDEVAELWLDLDRLSHRVASLQRYGTALTQAMAEVLQAPRPTPVPQRRQRLSKTLVLQTLTALGQDVALQTLLDQLQRHDPAITGARLSPMLTRMRQEGLIERMRHGHYQVASPRRRLIFIAPAAG